MPTSSPMDATVGEAAVVVLWLSQWNRAGPRARSLWLRGAPAASKAADAASLRRASEFPPRAHPHEGWPQPP
jgi:hypothetical protein